MQTDSPFNFEYSYLDLPSVFYSLEQPAVFPNPQIVLLNNQFCKQLNIDTSNHANLLTSFFTSSVDASKSFSQAYAGHQFGNFTKLGDGRAIVLGEHITQNLQRFDVQLKGSGRTAYSRGGDGKATLKAMLREFLISEAMHHLKIPTSRSLAVISTGEPVYRTTLDAGAVLVRVMKSHLRVGTFEFAARFGSIADLKGLTQYTINRLYPQIEEDKNPTLSLLNAVIEQQVALVAQWCGVGFIHGVMNTDNTSISGETFDYGPCAFMNMYNPNTVYSSIDNYGRYAFGNQYQIIKWNIARFAETLLPILDDDKAKSLAMAQAAIDGFDAIWKNTYYDLMLKKIGIATNDAKLYALVDDLLDIMLKHHMDYTNTFWDLATKKDFKLGNTYNADFVIWIKKWEAVINKVSNIDSAQTLMQQYNPIVIPRNHLVEQALNEATKGNLDLYIEMLKITSKPYQFQTVIDMYMQPSTNQFEQAYQTFCGT